MKKLLAGLAIIAFLAAATPAVHDTAEHAYPKPLSVEQA